MGLLIAMAIGFTLARFLPLEKYNKIIGFLQVIVTLILIFSMGYSLGCRENFLSEIKDIGIKSIIYCIVPTLFSIIAVYIATSIYFKLRKGGK